MAKKCSSRGQTFAIERQFLFQRDSLCVLSPFSFCPSPFTFLPEKPINTGASRGEGVFLPFTHPSHPSKLFTSFKALHSLSSPFPWALPPLSRPLRWIFPFIIHWGLVVDESVYGGTLVKGCEGWVKGCEGFKVTLHLWSPCVYRLFRQKREGWRAFLDFPSKIKQAVRLTRAESPEAPSPGHRPGLMSGNQCAL